jgi:hypothetical protein
MDTSSLITEARTIYARLGNLVIQLEGELADRKNNFSETYHLTGAMGYARAAATLFTFGVNSHLDCFASLSKKEPQ